jgi:hypothetical protein
MAEALSRIVAILLWLTSLACPIDQVRDSWPAVPPAGERKDLTPGS